MPAGPHWGDVFNLITPSFFLSAAPGGNV